MQNAEASVEERRDWDATPYIYIERDVLEHLTRTSDLHRTSYIYITTSSKLIQTKPGSKGEKCV